MRYQATVQFSASTRRSSSRLRLGVSALSVLYSALIVLATLCFAGAVFHHTHSSHTHHHAAATAELPHPHTDSSAPTYPSWPDACGCTFRALDSTVLHAHSVLLALDLPPDYTPWEPVEIIPNAPRWTPLGIRAPPACLI